MEKTPGVYVVEQPAFPNSIVWSETALPAFIGYTAKARDGQRSLVQVPTRIETLSEFQEYFGGAPEPVFAIETSTASEGVVPLTKGGAALPQRVFKVSGESGDRTYQLTLTGVDYALYGAIRMFFLNGGGTCYITSIGSYEDPIEAAQMMAALDGLKSERAPALVVIPEATRLPHAEAMKVQNHMLTHCGEEVRNRFAILDVPGGFLPLDGPGGKSVERFRAGLTPKARSYGADYYPWLNATVFTASDFSFCNLDMEGRKTLKAMLEESVEDVPDALQAHVDTLAEQPLPEAKEATALDQTLRAAFPLYGTVMHAIADARKALPPSGAMAGVYCMVDNMQGVWKAPANVSLGAVRSPTVDVSNRDQEDLNAPLDGMSICAIRSFVGRGTMVWGARTLDGNSKEWRYVPVRRLANMIEESVKRALEAFVFEPNDTATWASIRGMIEEFLTNVWKQGGLSGTTNGEAFQVSIGLGESMTAEDIRNGDLKAIVGFAPVRPGEFVILSIQQKMQTN
ncbi:hypothetical protein PGB28_06915 [Primorskyibacter aestuariivivens]|uniref:phage tail sheath family protein n=1 Tax=Primorskyibacter aestuariivivens TaxID=1888912 RepID=UPI0022FFCF69|nr:phage tail sheath C-terminal domain-containing protein [Primorskyibacter aestuariivivens]MDA7428183.1 hypothetical protein [Primorskyibacter aestuariivivens]